jgi:tRNA/rRNA methyltransferase
VLLFCYELRKGLQETVEASVRELAPTASVEPLYEQMETVLLKIGFLKPENPAHLMRSFRRIFARAALDCRDVSILRGMFSQVDWAADAFHGKKGK